MNSGILVFRGSSSTTWISKMSDPINYSTKECYSNKFIPKIQCKNIPL